MTTIGVRLRDWTTTPGARYRTDGPFSGEAWREEVLKPALLKVLARRDFIGRLVIDMRGDDIAGYPQAFIEEAVGGLVRDADIQRALMERPDARAVFAFLEWSCPIDSLGPEITGLGAEILDVLACATHDELLRAEIRGAEWMLEHAKFEVYAREGYGPVWDDVLTPEALVRRQRAAAMRTAGGGQTKP